MAEVHIQKKKSPTIWPWVVGVIAVALIIWGIVSRSNNGTETAAVDTTTAMFPTDETAETMDTTGSGPIHRFTMFVTQHAASDDMGESHDYTAEGIRSLAGALDAIVTADHVGDVNIETKRDTLMARADRIQRDSTSLNHADVVRDAFVSAADLMETIQKKRYPELQEQTARLKTDAEAIDPGTPLLDQKHAVGEFFRQADGTLREMTTPSGSTMPETR